ncbi:hypothetical protein CCACVL1_05183 [Corchorus capsularis]|uniref:Uncharacterized protein n=1 Tax=Corchorus capsularis TaxID=210143 RepID=A0A1R3JMG2_COCAP|nr:hypothetical protein CCACVL1_05183 [Corchorus capsularis]
MEQQRTGIVSETQNANQQMR